MSHFQTAGQAAYSVSKPASWPCQKMNRTKKSANYKIQKNLQIQKGLFSRSATGWMLHFNVYNINAFSTKCTKGHVVEKATGVTHIEINTKNYWK